MTKFHAKIVRKVKVINNLFQGTSHLAFKAVGIRVLPRVIKSTVVPASSFTLKNAHKQ